MFELYKAEYGYNKRIYVTDNWVEMKKYIESYVNCVLTMIDRKNHITEVYFR